MIYLLDANTLINAKNEFYPVNNVPEFWEWLVHHGEEGKVKIPSEIYDEFADTVQKDGTADELALWASQQFVQDALLFDEEADADLVSRVLYGGYLKNPTDEDIRKVGFDPFLISYALKDVENRCIVSGEVSKPTLQNANRRVPDVCDGFNIRCIHYFTFFRELNFSTRWRSQLKK